MEPTKNIPPAFIVEACSVLSTDVKRDQTVFTPDIIRRARLGEATEQDMRQVRNSHRVHVDYRLIRRPLLLSCM